MKESKDLEDIVNLNISDEIDKDLNTDNENNSIFDKSLQDGEITFPELIENKEFLQVKLNELNTHIQLSSKSIKNIFCKISDEENLENNYFDYILCLVTNDTEKEETVTEQEQSISNAALSLDPVYVDILNKTKNFYISLHNNNYNKRIKLKKNSLSKIFKFLNSDILQMNDYIEIVILSNDEKDFDSIEKGILLRSKLMRNSTKSNFDEEKLFDGHRKISMIQIHANKTKKSNIEKLNKYFENVFAYIENKDKTPLGKNSLISFSSKNNVDDEFGVHLIPNSRTAELRNVNGEKGDDNKKSERISTENCCKDTPCAEPCAGICIIF